RWRRCRTAGESHQGACRDRWRRARRLSPAAAGQMAKDGTGPGGKVVIGALIARDVRRGLTGATWIPVAFFLLVVALMPFAIGPDAHLLARVGPGVLWIAALTAALVPIERLI